MSAASLHPQFFSAAGHLQQQGFERLPQSEFSLATGLNFCELFYPRKDCTLTSNDPPNDMGEKEDELPQLSPYFRVFWYS